MGESLKISTSIASLESDVPVMVNPVKRREVELKPQSLTLVSTSKNLIYFFGPEILEEPTFTFPLTVGKVSEKPAKPGLVEKFRNFWKRHFGSLSETESRQVKQIQSTIRHLEGTLDSDALNLKNMRLAKKSRQGESVDQESLKETKERQKDFQASLRFAISQLNRLRALELTAETLAQKHTKCEDLPKQIQALTQQINVLKGRVLISEELQHLEESIVHYSQPNQGSWENFVAIKQQKSKFEQTLRQVIADRPELQKDKNVQMYLKQEGPLTGTTLNRILQRTYPQLSAHFEHLIDNLFVIQEKRISQLEQKATRMNTLFKAYNQIAKEIGDLEKYIYTPSKKQLSYQTQFNEKQDKLAEVVIGIEKEGNFSEEEANWVHALANQHSQYKLVSHNIREMSQAFVAIDNREDVSEQISNLIDLLEPYKVNLESTKNQQKRAVRQSRRSKTQPNSQRISSVNQQDSITVAMDSSRRKLVKNIADSLETAVTTIYEESRQVVSQLPANFEDLSLIEQLTTLTVLAFPKLQNRVSHLTHLMQAIANLQTDEQPTLIQQDKQPTLTQQLEEIIRKAQQPVAIEIKAETKAAPQLDPLQQDFIEPEEPSVIVTTPITTENAPTATANETVSPTQEEEKQQETQTRAETRAQEPNPTIIPSSEPVVEQKKDSSGEAKEEPKVTESPKTEPPKTGTVPPPPPLPPISKTSTALRINKTVKKPTARDALLADIRTQGITLKKATDRILPKNPIIPKNAKTNLQDDLVASMMTAIAKRGRLMKG